MALDEWPRYFSQYDRESKDETGMKTVYQNDMEQLYQMFIARLISEKRIPSEAERLHTRLKA
jgi:hypothetical protein